MHCKLLSVFFMFCDKSHSLNTISPIIDYFAESDLIPLSEKNTTLGLTDLVSTRIVRFPLSDLVEVTNIDRSIATRSAGVF